MPAPPQPQAFAPSKGRTRHYVGMPVGLTVHDLKSFRVGDRLRSMTVGCLRLILGIKDQRDPSIFTGLKVETKAIWNHLDVINPHVHVESPSKNNNTDKRSIDRRIQFRYAVITISMTTRAVTRAARTLCIQCSKTRGLAGRWTNRRAYLCLPSWKNAFPPQAGLYGIPVRGRELAAFVGLHGNF